MPAAVAIAERILRQVVREVESITSIDHVGRMTAHGRWWDGSAWIENRENSDAMVVFQGEQEIEQALGDNTAPCYLRMSVAIVVITGQAETSTTPVDSLIRNWNALVRQALMTNPFLTETVAPTQRLAIDSRIVSIPDVVAGESPREFDAFTFMDIDYVHRRNNPFVGPGITQLEE